MPSKIHPLTALYVHYLSNYVSNEGAPKGKIIVIGSGIAGLMAARQLKEFGFEVTIYEARVCLSKFPLLVFRIYISYFKLKGSHRRSDSHLPKRSIYR